jgi:hypothetical protein
VRLALKQAGELAGNIRMAEVLASRESAERHKSDVQKTIALLERIRSIGRLDTHSTLQPANMDSTDQRSGWFDGGQSLHRDAFAYLRRMQRQIDGKRALAAVPNRRREGCFIRSYAELKRCLLGLTQPFVAVLENV